MSSSSRAKSAEVIEHGYHYMYSAATLSMRLYDESEPREPLHLANVYVMCAFALEAYVNELCELSLPARLWNTVERRATTMDKLTFVESFWHTQFDYSSLPFQLVKEIFRVRDAFAHARRTALPALEDRDGEQIVLRPRAPIETYLGDSRKAKSFLSCVYELMGYLDRYNPSRRRRTHPMESAAVSTYISLELVPLPVDELPNVQR